MYEFLKKIWRVIINENLGLKFDVLFYKRTEI